MTTGEYLLSKSSLMTGMAIDHFASMQAGNSGISISQPASIGLVGVEAINLLAVGQIIPVKSGNTIEIG